MLFKKSTAALCSSSSSNLSYFLSSPHSCFCITSPCSSNSRSPQWPNSKHQSQIQSRAFPRQRCYATVSDRPKKSGHSSGDHHHWPSSSHPTPYEIFDQQKSAPYSKSKFYELVKIYHPDRHRHIYSHTLSHAAQLERYRLIVAANQILSDPEKRRAYDLYGSGWGGVRSMENLSRAGYKSWRDVPGNASMNATWEDWERWYNERDGKKEPQQPVYMSNQLFASVLCIFVVVGTFGQARRASTNTMDLVEMQEQHHAAISHDMMRRQSEQAVLNRHERIENFLRQRDGWAIASTNTHGEAASERNRTIV
ncbi:hypothetical protein F4804DRAFT_310285 [Jackrogersella minutella]|nr:hypothetical protein F4804DRAFT_310285 [Jackrogersella minutella]